VFVQQLYGAWVEDTLPVGSSIVTVSATDRDVSTQPQTPNSQIAYSIAPAYPRAAQFFSVNSNTGEVFLVLPLKGDINLITNYTFEVIGRNPGKTSLSSRCWVSVLVNRTEDTGTAAQGIRFIQTTYIVEKSEDVSGGLASLRLVNVQPGDELQCDITSVDRDNLFEVVYNPSTTSCDVSLQQGKSLDRERAVRYDLTLRVVYATNTRTKRQAVASPRSVQLVILVDDVNDNAPSFVPPPYAPSMTNFKYFGIVEVGTHVLTPVLTVKATDPDDGPRKDVIFSILPSNKSPFYVDKYSGTVYTSAPIPANKTGANYTFTVQASNELPLVGAAVPADISVIIHVVNIDHMLSLSMPGTPQEINKNKDQITRALSEATGHIILIENVNELQTPNGPSRTEVVFVAVDKNTERPIESKSDAAESVLSADSQMTIGQVLNTTDINIIVYSNPSVDELKDMVSGIFSYKALIGLVAVAGVSIVVSILGMIIVCHKYSQYRKVAYYRRNYPDSIAAPSSKGYSDATFIEPPTVLPEYETQSLAMYVPPDEPVQEQGEVSVTTSVPGKPKPPQVRPSTRMTLDEDGLMEVGRPGEVGVANGAYTAGVPEYPPSYQVSERSAASRRTAGSYRENATPL
jgi:hypothetical protein